MEISKEYQEMIDSIKISFGSVLGDDFDDNEISWYTAYVSSICILEDLLNCHDHKLNPTDFITNKDNYVFWQGMKLFCNNVTISSDIVGKLHDIDENIGFTHATLDEHGIVFYFTTDPIYLVKDKMGYIFSTILREGLIGEKDNLFACNYQYLQNIIINIQEHQTLKHSKDINKKTYVMRDTRSGYYKIGYSNNPTFRETTLQSEKPDIELLFYCDSFIEKELHDKYFHCRIRGEWFNLSDNCVLDIFNRMFTEPNFTVVKNKIIDNQ